MRRKMPRGLSLVWVVLISMVAMDCSHAVGADAAQAAEENPADRAARAVKIVGIDLTGDVVTVSPDPIVLKVNQDILVFQANAEPLSIQFKDDNNPFGEQPDCRRRTCIFRGPAVRTGTFHYTVMVRGKVRDPRVEVQP